MTAPRRLCEFCGNRGRWSGLAARGPFRVVTGAVVERLLRADSGGRQTGIEVGAAYRFALGESLTEEHGEASDEGVARAGAVHTLHGEGGKMFHAFAAREQRAVRAQ